MRVSLADAETRLPDRVERAEAGETIILAQDGRPIVRLETIGLHRIDERGGPYWTTYGLTPR